jgi:hypothetical protein
MIFLATNTLLAEFFIQFFSVYLLVGVFFHIFFVTIGMKKLDSATLNTSIWFKLLIAPGSIALWPILLYKLLKLKP